MLLQRKKSQGILEYTILLAAIVSALVVVVTKQGGLGTKVSSSYDKMGSAIETTTNDFTKSISPTTP